MPDRWRVEDWIPSKPSSKNPQRFDRMNRPMTCRRMAAGEAVDIGDLFISQAGIGFGDGDEHPLAPHTEGVVGEQSGTPTAPRFGGDHDGINGVRGDF